MAFTFSYPFIMRNVFLIALHAIFFLSATAQVKMFQGGPSHEGFIPQNVHSYFGDANWIFKSNGKIFSSPVVYESKVYVGSADGFVYALDKRNGKLIWKFKTSGVVHSTPAVTNDVVIVGSFDGNYYCLNSKNGKEKWRFKTGGERWPGGDGYWGMKPDSVFHTDPWEFFLSSPVVDQKGGESTVYFGSGDGNVYAVDVHTGKERWNFKTDGIVHSSPALANGILYVGSWDTYLYALDASSGKLIWKYKTADTQGMSGIQTSPTIGNGMVYFGARDPYFFALDAKTGELKWKYDAEKSWILSTAALHDNTIYVGTSDTFLVLALDATTGTEKWRTKVPGWVYASPCLAGNTLFVGDFTGRLYSINTVTGKLEDTFETETFRENYKAILMEDTSMNFQKLAEGRDQSLYSTLEEVMDTFYRLGPIVSSAAITENRLFVGSANGNLYAIELKEKPNRSGASNP